MFEKFTSADAGDFRQRYQGTYGYFRQADNKTLVRLDKVNFETNNKTVEFVDEHGLTYTLHADSHDETVGFDFLPPKISYHNGENNAWLLRRIPARQYQRGICDRNTSIRTVDGIIFSVDFAILKKLFNNKYSPKETFAATTHSTKTEQSFALSSQFAVSLSRGRIYCLGQSIGQVKLVNSDFLSIILNDPLLWGTEIRDCLHRTEINGEVK